jgi:type IV fimbrial biogenesis protein FimT
MGAIRSRRRLAGFTVAEMLVVVAIMGILAAIATPYMGDMIRRQRIKTAAFDVFSSLAFARSEAIKRNTSVTITPTGGNWNEGWQITDSNNNMLRQQSGWETLSAVGPLSVVFASSGRPTAQASISLSSTGVEASSYRCVKLDLSGRAVSKEGACS